MGTQRCPMATYRTNLAAQTTLRWPGPALAGDASGTQRDFMDLRHRGAVARTAQEISAVPDLPSPFPALGAGGQTGTHLARSSGGVAGSRKIATGGGFHRRLLHGGKKRGLAVGPTKRGKGTKIIALADDHSLPLAVSIESASPHESQLVEGVLGHSFLATLPARLIGDKAYDSDRLDRELAERYGIEMISNSVQHDDLATFKLHPAFWNIFGPEKPRQLDLQLNLLSILGMSSGQVGGKFSISAPVVQEAARIDCPLSAVRTCGVFTCSGRNPTPIMRAGMRRRIGQRRCSFRGHGRVSGFALPRTRRITLF